jgi:hypothetical protein
MCVPLFNNQQLHPKVDLWNLYSAGTGTRIPQAQNLQYISTRYG